MSAKIYVPLDDAWDFFEDNLEALKKQYVELASDDTDDFNSVIYMTEKEGFPELLVEVSGIEIEKVKAYSSTHLRSLLEEFYSDYILFNTSEEEVGEEDEGMQFSEPNEIDEAVMRDDSLVCALDDFLQVALDEGTYEGMFSTYGYDMQRLVLQSIVDMFFDRYDICVYWPHVVIDEDGNETVVADGYNRVSTDELLGGNQNDV